MSLQMLNEEFQLELAQDERKERTHPLSGAFQRLRGNSTGSILKREYPDSRRLEELLGE